MIERQLTLADESTDFAALSAGRVGATDSGAVPLWASAATGVPSQGDLLQGTHRAAAAVAGAGSAARAASWGVPLAFGSPDTMATPVWPGFGAAEAAPVSEALATAKHAQQQWHAAAGDAVSAVHGQQAHLQPAMQAVNSPLLQAAQQQPFGQSSTRTPGTHLSTFVAAPEATAAPPATTVESLFMGQQQQQQPSAAAAPASPAAASTVGLQPEQPSTSAPASSAVELYTRLERAAVNRARLEAALAEAQAAAAAAERRASAAEARAAAAEAATRRQGTLAAELKECRSQLDAIAAEQETQRATASTATMHSPAALAHSAELEHRLAETMQAANEAVAARGALQLRVEALERERLARGAVVPALTPPAPAELVTEHEALQADFAALLARATRDRDALRSARAEIRVLAKLKDAGERSARDRAALLSAHAKVDKQMNAMHRRAVQAEAENKLLSRLIKS